MKSFIIKLGVVTGIVLLLFSCSVCKRCVKKCPDCIPEKTIVDSSHTKETIIKVDTLIKVANVDSAKIKAEVKCIDGKANMKETVVKKGKTTIKAKVTDGKLEAECFTDSLEAKISFQNKVIEKYRQRLEKEVRTINLTKKQKKEAFKEGRRKGINIGIFSILGLIALVIAAIFFIRRLI